jgi:hypothetical protein
MVWVIGILVFIFACVLAAMALVAWSVFSGDVWHRAKLDDDWDRQSAPDAAGESAAVLQWRKSKFGTGAQSGPEQPRGFEALDREARKRKMRR